MNLEWYFHVFIASLSFIDRRLIWVRDCNDLGEIDDDELLEGEMFSTDSYLG